MVMDKPEEKRAHIVITVGGEFERPSASGTAHDTQHADTTVSYNTKAEYERAKADDFKDLIVGLEEFLNTTFCGSRHWKLRGKLAES